MAIRKAPAPAPVVAPPSWTGWYVGVHAGANWQTVDAGYNTCTTSQCNSHSDDGAFPTKAFDAGFIGGGQLGYNWQFAPTWVLGIEGTISGLTGKATANSFHNKGTALSGEITWLATLRGRVGWLMDPDTMLYGTGGVAWGGVKNSVNAFGLGAGAEGVCGATNCAFTTKSVSSTRTGWVAGGGIEHMLGGAWSHWTVGLEVLYVDLGNSIGHNAAGTAKTSFFRNQAAIGQLKLNYKF